MDIHNSITDIHNWITDIHNSIMDIHNSIFRLDIRCSIMDIQYMLAIMDIHNWIMDVQNYRVCALLAFHRYINVVGGGGGGGSTYSETRLLVPDFKWRCVASLENLVVEISKGLILYKDAMLPGEEIVPLWR